MGALFFSIKSPELFFKIFWLIGWIFIALLYIKITFLITYLSVKYHQEDF